MFQGFREMKDLRGTYDKGPAIYKTEEINSIFGNDSNRLFAWIKRRGEQLAVYVNLEKREIAAKERSPPQSTTPKNKIPFCS